MQRFPIFALALLCLWGNGETEARTLRVLESSAVAAPRFAEGDLDGDGISELVVGGRVGPFRPVTDPVGAKEARIEVYAQEGGWMDPAAASGNLHLVDDVAAGDLDGDGRSEIVAVGDYRIFVLGYEAGALEVRQEEVLALGRFVRVDCADLDGDGRSEVAAAELLPGGGEEVPVTEVRLYRFDGGWREEGALRLDGHVGDLCLADLDGDGRVELVLEQGAEEIGGRISVYDLEGGAIRERFHQQATPGQVRALNLAVEIQGETALLGVGDVRGRIGLWRFRGERFSLIDELQAEGGFPSGLHLTCLFGTGRVQLLSGSTGPAARNGWIGLMEGMAGY